MGSINTNVIHVGLILLNFSCLLQNKAHSHTSNAIGLILQYFYVRVLNGSKNPG